MSSLAVICRSLRHRAAIISVKAVLNFSELTATYYLKVENRNRRPKYTYLPHYYGLSLYQKMADTAGHLRYHHAPKDHQHMFSYYSIPIL